MYSTMRLTEKTDGEPGQESSVPMPSLWFYHSYTCPPSIILSTGYSSIVHNQYRHESLWLQTELEGLTPCEVVYGGLTLYRYTVCLVQEDSKPGATGGIPRV